MKFLIKMVFGINIISNFISIIAYVIGAMNIDLFAKFLGFKEINSAFLIAGANILRASLPQIGPNQLGFYLAPNILLLIYFIYINKIYFRNRNILYSLLMLDFGLLCLTFSRSSILTVIVAVIVIAAFRPGKYIKTFFKWGTVSCILFGIFLFSADKLSQGNFSVWVKFNTSFKDPSLQGHSNSILESLNKYDEYYLSGFEKGIVGPKAALFGKTMMNSENSLIVMVFEMGIFQFIFLSLGYLFLFPRIITNIFQMALMIGLLVNIQFLPSIFETGPMTNFIAMIAFLGNKSILSIRQI